jgi:hypothetical protein
MERRQVFGVLTGPLLAGGVTVLVAALNPAYIHLAAILGAAGASMIGASLLIWIILWLTGGKRHEPIPKFDLPFSEAARYIARSSRFAAKLTDDPDWVPKLQAEMAKRLGLAHLQAMGRRYRPARDSGPSSIPWEFWHGLEDPNVHQLMLDNTTQWPVTNRDGRAYTDVVLDSAQLRRVWPQRSWISAILRRSPVERAGFDKEWKAEDRRLSALENRLRQR